MCKHEVVNRYQDNRWCEDCGESLGATYKIEDFIHDNPLDSDYML